jgi:hypothetical protein
MIEILIAAIAGPVLVLFISELFRYLNSKKEKEERFFYEVYPKRMELYEELIRATDFVPYQGEIQLIDTLEKRIDFLNEKNRILIELAVRCVVYGSHMVFHAVNDFNGLFITYCQHLSKTHDFRMEDFNAFVATMAGKRVKIAELIGEESGARIIDNKIADFLRDLKKKQRSPNNIAKEK